MTWRIVFIMLFLTGGLVALQVTASTPVDQKTMQESLKTYFQEVIRHNQGIGEGSTTFFPYFIMKKGDRTVVLFGEHHTRKVPEQAKQRYDSELKFNLNLIARVAAAGGLVFVETPSEYTGEKGEHCKRGSMKLSSFERGTTCSLPPPATVYGILKCLGLRGSITHTVVHDYHAFRALEGGVLTGSERDLVAADASSPAAMQVRDRRMAAILDTHVSVAPALAIMGQDHLRGVLDTLVKAGWGVGRATDENAAFVQSPEWTSAKTAARSFDPACPLRAPVPAADAPTSGAP